MAAQKSEQALAFRYGLKNVTNDMVQNLDDFVYEAENGYGWDIDPHSHKWKVLKGHILEARQKIINCPDEKYVSRMNI